MAEEEIFQTLRAAITQKPPFCTGVVPIDKADSNFFYKKGEDAAWLDLASAPEEKLQALAEACEPATFGLNQHDVLDESYRKAGKMDSDKFFTKFDVHGARIVDYVREQLLDGAADRKVIRAELYKLNVYGKGSFFKSHKDTPRGNTMFGSLVVVFPTAHEGGALVLRHSGKEWTFDSGSIIRENAVPSVAYIAFYSDVDHEVTPVTSGYRLTLTYNLFLEAKPGSTPFPRSIAPVVPDGKLLHDALSAALANPDFLSEGGYLGFGLAFKYPISPSAPRSNFPVLKGSDAVISRVCRQLSLSASRSLSASLNVIYSYYDVEVLVDVRHILDENDQYDDIVETLCSEYGGKVIRNDAYSSYRDGIEVTWVTPLTHFSGFESSYIAYGNEATAASIYGDLCLIVEVGPYGARG